MNKKVGIILVNYKDYARKFLTECRDSLKLQSYSDFIVYIVDNASSDDSFKYLSEIYGEAKIIKRKDGNYAAANNTGIKRAREDVCDYFVIANMDTRFDKNWLGELVKAIEMKKDAGMVQSKVLIYSKGEDKDVKINSLGNIQHFLGFGFTSGYGKKDKNIEELKEIKGYASGCSFIISREVFDKIGEYDEEYWMYHDDLEMGWRARLAGFKIYLAPKSIVYHKYEFGRSIKMLYYMERNRYLSIFHYYSLLTLILILPALFIMELGMIVYSVPGKWFKTKMRANFYFLKPSTWFKIIKKRKRINKIRKIKDREVVQFFSGKVLFQEIDNPVLKYIANPVLSLYWVIVKKIIFW
ncbi:glycosyltransferase family 2 protein [bacterium]|nr:glycosyltransferase family 2 protein [bacterium]